MLLCFVILLQQHARSSWVQIFWVSVNSSTAAQCYHISISNKFSTAAQRYHISMSNKMKHLNAYYSLFRVPTMIQGCPTMHHDTKQKAKTSTKPNTSNTNKMNNNDGSKKNHIYNTDQYHTWLMPRCFLLGYWVICSSHWRSNRSLPCWCCNYKRRQECTKATKVQHTFMVQWTKSSITL